jgi:CHAD domain-containing protein
MARKQITQALAALGGPEGKAAGNRPGQLPADEAIHDARKRLKRVRAYLRLLRPALGAAVYRRENTGIRDAARPLTAIRDAKVLVETFDKLIEQFRGALDESALGGVRRYLATNQEETRRQVLEEDALKRVMNALAAARVRIKRLRVGKSGWSVLGLGLRRVYRRGRNAFASVLQEPSADNLHEWRKQAKYLWHGLEVFGPLWPVVVDELATETHKLADYLGDDHDLAVLRQRLREVISQFPDLAAVEALMALIDRRRNELQEQAYALGRLLYKEKPKRLAERLEGYWHAWRSEPAATAPFRKDGNLS